MNREMKLLARPILGRKSRANNVPTRIKGRLRPREKLERSLIAPATGCTSTASARPVKVRMPR